MVRTVNGIPLGWRPIKSAPKNEPIIFYDEEWEATLGAIQIGSIDDDGSGRTAESDEFRPTHWMPLPLPPKTD
jgi:hypothetical protein